MHAQDSVLSGGSKSGLVLQKLGLYSAPVLRIHMNSPQHHYRKHVGPRTLDDVVTWVASDTNGSVRPEAAL